MMPRYSSTNLTGSSSTVRELKLTQTSTYNSTPSVLDPGGGDEGGGGEGGAAGGSARTCGGGEGKSGGGDSGGEVVGLEEK
mmetsp:Transcript_1218/g.1736  ORF Transcript_1218/g.1736 Transcript_1218/m.1736 type:complete len:81 (+) Transcript_1218:746-988(+)